MPDVKTRRSWPVVIRDGPDGRPQTHFDEDQIGRDDISELFAGVVCLMGKKMGPLNTILALERAVAGLVRMTAARVAGGDEAAVEAVKKMIKEQEE